MMMMMMMMTLLNHISTQQQQQQRARNLPYDMRVFMVQYTDIYSPLHDTYL